MLGQIVAPTKKPDFDNIAKIISDACNGIVYKDDAQIVHAVIAKRWSHDEHVDVTIRAYDVNLDGV
jgi:Holliday junction resolvase RusA-like endonuclease